MPTQTGTASTAVDLLNQLNTFLTANGWTNLRGNTDLACASPKAARYWRILVIETDDVNSDYREIRKLSWKTTVGGANVATDNNAYSFSDTDGGTYDLVGGSDPVRSSRLYDDRWWVQYDFGTPTVIREIDIQADTDNEAPAEFYVQWSNDGFSWTTMFYQPYDSNLFTADQQTATFTFDDGYLDPRHASPSIPRRGGFLFFGTGQNNTRHNESSDDIWCWQGPGYDATRRVYVSAAPFYDLTSGDEMVVFNGSIAVDTNLIAADWWTNQSGAIANADTFDNTPTLTFSSSGISYWFYCNSKRFIVVVKSGVDEYSMCYCGFLSAFALPDDWPFPLAIGASTWSVQRSLSESGTYIRDAQDPVDGAMFYRSWDGTWRKIQSHGRDTSDIQSWKNGTYEAVVWPKHIGVAGRADFPLGPMGDYLDPLGHYFHRMEPTEQGELPLVSSLVVDHDFGFVGALDGVYAVPQGGVLAPEATITVGADTYRVFTTRNHAEGNAYYAIKEV